MNHPPRAAALLALAAVLALPACDPHGAATPEPPKGILLITVDGLVPDELSIFGGPRKVPGLAALAEGGAAWRDGWTVCPMTRPAVATYLTGLAPDRHGVRDDLFAVLPEATPTLASLLAERGYQVAAFPDSSFLGFSSGLLRGYTVVDDPPTAPISPGRWLPWSHDADETAEHVSAWLDSLAPEARYFGWVHFSQPYQAQLYEQMKEERRKIREDVEKQRAAAKPPATEEQAQAEQEQHAEDAEDRSQGPSADLGPFTPEPQAGPGQSKGKGKGKAPAKPLGVEAFDAALQQILATINGRGDGARVLILVAGTQGDQNGGAGEPRGSGFSLHPRAVRVPVLARFPEGVRSARPADRPVWAPDVPATIAAFVGLRLEGNEGVSLLEDAPADRVLYSFSWALLDQMGWQPERAARSGAVVRYEGQAGRTTDLAGAPVEADAALDERLTAGLAARAQPQAAGVPPEIVAPALAVHGIVVAPQPTGRVAGDAALRLEVAREIWRGRLFASKRMAVRAQPRFARALELDPDDKAALLDYGQLHVFSQPAKAREILGHGLKLYPSDPELLHWYAHALWPESRAQAKQLLELVVPYKPQEGDLLYDLACLASLDDDLPTAEKYLRSAIEAGFRNWSHMETDPDLRKLREAGRFSAVLKEYRR